MTDLATCVVKKMLHADWAWAEEEAMIDRCAATEAAVKTDHAEAVVWIRRASQKRLDIPRIDITEAADSNHPSSPPDGSHAGA